MQQCVPKDSETDPERVSELNQKLLVHIEKLEESEFFTSFLKQMRSTDMLKRFSKVLGSEEKMKLVIYGIGSIESRENSCSQLSLAILMKRRFDWIGDIEVFDPIISSVESNVLKSQGCSVLSINEEGGRKVVEPTLFFMPHCTTMMYENLLKANWGGDQLNRVIVLGNSFNGYNNMLEAIWGRDKLNRVIALGNSFNGYEFDARVPQELAWLKHVLAVTSFTEEFKVATFPDFSHLPFNRLSWHFFNPVEGKELEI